MTSIQCTFVCHTKKNEHVDNFLRETSSIRALFMSLILGGGQYSIVSPRMDQRTREHVRFLVVFWFLGTLLKSGESALLGAIIASQP